MLRTNLEPCLECVWTIETAYVSQVNDVRIRKRKPGYYCETVKVNIETLVRLLNDMATDAYEH